MTIQDQLDAIAAERVLILDGAMGSQLLSLKLTESDFRGSRFADHAARLQGCNDLLCLTRPEAVLSIHEDYLKAGADIIETCSFNATSLSLADYGLGALAWEISAAAADIARKAADQYSTPDKPRFVAGSMGPTAKSACLSPDINDPAKRSVVWDELEAAYYDNARGLLDGGADILILETIFDTLNAKAACSALVRLMEERNVRIPLMISATVSDTAGRLLSGQTVEAFWVSIAHCNPWSVGLNCSFGAEKLKAPLRNLAAFAPVPVSAYPNAGMPDRFGFYDESPDFMADQIEEYLKEGLVNIVGGCCGTTPAHIAAIAARARKYSPRRLPPPKRPLFLSGLEAFPISREQRLTLAGEQTHTAESRELFRLIVEEDYDGAVEVARTLVEKGAAVTTVSVDDSLSNAEKAVTGFLSLALSYPDVAKRPFLIESSRWEVIEAALKLLQGKSLVKFTGLKEGTPEFIRKSRLIRRYGAELLSEEPA
ncbi:MAG: homocysteine S-methyltransferase family protein [Treponema sp.]|jgi:5-methyltetrahydrofolate--homocysteine methyltransferase|nr:homocysteine S-methyltransferase family protein [Treponema sp.]